MRFINYICICILYEFLKCAVINVPLIKKKTKHMKITKEKFFNLNKIFLNFLINLLSKSKKNFGTKKQYNPN